MMRETHDDNTTQYHTTREEGRGSQQAAESDPWSEEETGLPKDIVR